MPDRYVEFIQDIIITIHENIRELKDRKTFASPEELSYIEAKLLTYHEMLAIIQVSADQFKIPRNEIGI